VRSFSLAALTALELAPPGLVEVAAACGYDRVGIRLLPEPPAASDVAHCGRYSITAWSGASDCLRNAALVEPIMTASGIAHSVKIITIW
jgi:hypothetical protein